MSPLEKFYETTAKLIQVLEGTFDRDEKILLLDKLLAERDVLLKEIKRPNPEEDDLAGKVIMINRKLDMLLAKEKTLIQKDLKDLKNRKEKSDMYQNPYASVSVDGMFYDKRN
ncbi:flagellar protein FliT [Bacillus sp. ISL-45]|uniref:flagellar protein FliT n=1 Tax=Bacillus sp. ISL-45 TaxID=2819128 RepID=UPI001BE60755|nr:flagellar protein FliT [Bacillus sp. ISL-45]MBT2659649.1 flagellar protein FliT [Bacillus sp. ISL-45]